MHWLPVVIMMALSAVADPASQKLGEPRLPTAPETFSANVQASGTSGAAATLITIRVERYSQEADRLQVQQALKDGGHPAFLAALRKSPVVGTVTIAGRAFDIRWARQERTKNGRDIVLVTDKPVFFVGGGNVDAKPREGYDVALLKFRMDDSGVGYSGQMAAAARVKTGPAGVEIDDYAEKLIEFKTISRAFD